jgi:4-alpha-glucanotransferase
LKKVRFCFGIHNHQPVGNFGWVIEEAFQKSYYPFLVLLEKYPGVRISLHFTGILYDWMKEYHPEGSALVKKLVKRGQIELLTGGHFEPILPVIPDRDKVGQIRMLSDFIESEFGVTPTGMWLAERVWEPSLPKYLHQAGVKYTILDDIHFRYSGLQDSQLHGYYVTEDEGKPVALFPISKELRYAIPFADPEKTIEYLRDLANEECSNIGIYADDGEKFGVWPKTFEHCFEKGWLERFFKAISDNLEWIEMKHFGEVLQENAPLGTTYLPTASYSEMNEWAMPVSAIERYDTFLRNLRRADLLDNNLAFVKGGFWRNFLTKYPESNQLHKRMLYVSDLLACNKSLMSEADYLRAQRLLYAGQCNCPYWHGVFGGLYLPHLRGAVFQETVASERAISEFISSQDTCPRVEVFDFDADGNPEVVVTTARHKAFVAPALGGMITELDDFDVCKNLVDIVGRRQEGYHKKLLTRHEHTNSGTQSIHDLVLVKEEGLEHLLIEDRYRRGLFIDHFFGEDATLNSFADSSFAEIGDFVGGGYAFSQKSGGDKIELTLQRRGHVSVDGAQHQITLTKTIVFNSVTGKMTAHYKLSNDSRQTLRFRFGVELGFGSFTFPMQESAISQSDDRIVETAISVELSEVDNLRFDSRLYQYRIALNLSRKARLWTHPLWTVSLSEGGFEKVYQGTIAVPHWALVLEAGASWETEIGLSFERLTIQSHSTASHQTSDQVRS